ncbi:MAG: DUF4382 domain-containing protein [bacterium]|nr:DUF4382 domain-containing protein [bacterium]
MKNHETVNSLIALFAIVLLSTVGFIGCTDESNSNNSNPSQGEIKMYLVDSPSEYDAVNIVVTEVAVHFESSDSVSGWIVINDSVRTVNLLSLTNGTYELLGTHRLDIGRYSQVRLKVGTGSNIVVDGQYYPLNIPSGTQTGLKLNHQFDIASDALYELTLDFDVSRSIHLTGNHQYQMRPVIRVAANLVSGTIGGIVVPYLSTTLVSTTIGSDTVSTYVTTISGAFKLMALPAGNYSVMINSGSEAYYDSTLTGIAVIAHQNTSLGTIVLRHR